MFATLPVLLFAVAPAPASAEGWSQWRGPDRTGVSRETGLLSKWPTGGPKLVWEAKGAGRGYGQVTVSKGKVFVLGDGLSTAEDKDEYVSCFDEQSGKQLWMTKLGPAWNAGAPSWQSSRSTPTIVGDDLYVVTPHGVLVCLETQKGTLVWKTDLKKDLKGVKGDGWGYSEAPLIDGDRVIVTPGGSKATMAALDRKKGEVVWTTEVAGDNGAGHASIVVSEVGGVRVYVNTTANHVIGVQANDGKLLWKHKHKGSTAVIPTPIVRDDLVFYAAGYGAGGGLLRQPGEGGKVEVVYPQNGALTNKHGGIVLIGAHLYGCQESTTTLFCAELKTGKIVWKERAPGSGSTAVSAADGKLYLHAEDGTTTLVEASPDGYKALGTFKSKTDRRPAWSNPTISNGRLYLREGDTIYCYDVKNSADARR